MPPSPGLMLCWRAMTIDRTTRPENRQKVCPCKRPLQRQHEREAAPTTGAPPNRAVRASEDDFASRARPPTFICPVLHQCAVRRAIEAIIGCRPRGATDRFAPRFRALGNGHIRSAGNRCSPLSRGAGPLPCLCGGAKTLRLKPRPSDADWLAGVRSLHGAAVSGSERLDELKRLYRDAQHAILSRAGTLPSPASLYSSSNSFAAVRPGGVEVERGRSQQASGPWCCRESGGRGYPTAHLGEIPGGQSCGYVRIRIPEARPTKVGPPPLPADPSLSAIFDTFDEEMAEIDRLLARH